MVFIWNSFLAVVPLAGIAQTSPIEGKFSPRNSLSRSPTFKSLGSQSPSLSRSPTFAAMDNQSSLAMDYEKFEEEKAPQGSGLITSSQKQAYFEHKRLAFWHKPGIVSDLIAYSKGDSEYSYGPLKFKKFSNLLTSPFWNYKTRVDADTSLPEALNIKSENDPKDILIITNHYSFHTGQYEGDQKTRASMSFMHLMAIPTRRVFNAVSLPDEGLINKMKQEFVSSWPKIKKDAIERQRRIMVREAGGEGNVTDELQKAYEKMARIAEELEASDFVFGFHPAPACSVPHIHMHIIAARKDLREFSTLAHDDKTILIEDIIPVLRQKLPLEGVEGASTLTENPEWARKLLLGQVEQSQAGQSEIRARQPEFRPSNLKGKVGTF